MARILIVDDDRDLRDVIAEALTPGHHIVTASDGVDALTIILGGDRFDVILSDVMMPRLDGAKLHTQLIALAPEQAHRMVFMSRGVDPETRRLLSAATRPYLEKPFDMARLRECVAKVLDRWGPTR